MAPSLIQACRQLAELEVDGEVSGMHKAQMESLSMLALNFLQSSSAAQSQNSRLQTLEHNWTKIADMEESLNRAHREIAGLRVTLKEKDDALNGRIDDTNKSLANTATTLRGEIASSATTVINQMRKEIDTKMAEMTGAVTELEKSVKKCHKLANQNKDKIGVAVRKVEDIGEKMTTLKKTTDKAIKALTSTMKQQMDHLVHTVSTFKKETQTKLKQAEEKFEAFRFETQNGMARKADIEDLAKKLNVVDHKQFVETNKTEHKAIAEKQAEISGQMATAEEDRAELRRDTAGRMDTATQERQQLMTMLTKLRGQMDGAASPAQLCAELKIQCIENDEEIANQLREEMKNALLECGLLKTPAMSTSSGNCFSCGKPMSTAFSPMPKRDPMSPSAKSPGGGFNSRRSSMSKLRSPNMRSPSSRRRLSEFGEGKRSGTIPEGGEKEAVKLPPIAHNDAKE